MPKLTRGFIPGVVLTAAALYLLGIRSGEMQSSQADLLRANEGSRPADEIYSPEIAGMLEQSVPKDLQTRFESEEKEASWASNMEGQFAAYFAAKPELAQFDIAMIECRTSICEIHVLGHGPDAQASWTVAIADIAQQPWHNFNRMSVTTKDIQPDILGIVLVMSKNAD